MLPSLKSFKKIAVIQTAFLGDVALVLPLCEVLKNIAPESEITLITTPAATSLAQCAANIDHVVSYDKRGIHKGFSGIKALAHQLGNFDCVIAPHRSFRTVLLAKLLKPKYSVGFKNAVGSFLYSRAMEYPIHLHEIERNFSLLKAFAEGNELLKNDVKMRFSAEDENVIDEIFLKNSFKSTDKIVVLAPGSVWATKRWQAESFKKLAEILLQSGYKVIVTGSRDEQQLCAEITANSSAVNLAGKLSIPQSTCLLRRASVLVCNDSAPTHFAGLVNCPVITIFGPTSPIFGFAPRGEFSAIIQNETLQCRPCEIHGGKICPIGTHECMKSISPEMVFKKVEETLFKKQNAQEISQDL